MESDSEHSYVNSDAVNDIQFADLFHMDEIQKIQDLFSDATGVACIISHPDGTPISQPSNFCRLCELIRSTEKGLANCIQSNAELGRCSTSGPLVRPCLGAGLWSAGASITVGGKHIASWLIGQVRNEEIDEKQLLGYAVEIGVNPEVFSEALKEVPVMPTERFEKVAKMLFTFADELSGKAYVNWKLKQEMVYKEKVTEQLRKNEERFRMLFENSNDAIFLVDAHTGRYLHANNAAEKLTGRTADELSQLRTKDITPLGARKRLGHLQSPNPSCDFGEVTYLRPDGTTRTAMLNVIPLINGYIYGIARDITERKKADETILKLNRLYTVVSQINHAIVRINDKGKLLKEVCRIAVKYGKFRMSWIGLVNNSGGLISPVAFAGHENGYLSAIKIFIDGNVPEGKGPTAKAIREGRPFSCNDIANDPNMAVWKGEALKRGYRSSVALPLKSGNVTVGSFSLYASTPFFFDEAEIKLLEEVAENISFAIESIEKEKKRILAERMLQESDTRFRSFMYNFPGLAYMKDNEGRILFANEGFSSFLGMNPLAMINKTNYDFFPEEFAQKVTYDDRQVLHTCHTNRIEEIFAGRIWETYKFPIPQEDGRNILGGFTIDATDRRHAEEALRQSEKNIKAIFSSAPVGLLLFDEGLRIVDSNEVIARMVSRDPEQLIMQLGGNALGCVNSLMSEKGCGFSPDCPHCQLRNGIESVLKSEMPVHDAEVEFAVSANGMKNYLWLDVNAELMFLGGKKHVIVAITDITRRKQIEKELIVAKEKAEESDRLKSAFLANMSHEVRTPLNGLLGFADMLKEPGLEPQQQDECVKVMDKSAERLLEVIDNILDISKIESGQVKLNISDFDINSILHDVYALFKPDVEHKGMVIHLKELLPDERSVVLSDKEKIRFVLTSFVKNAIKFTDEGFIEIGCAIGDFNGFSDVRAKSPDWVTIYVKDTGSGVHPDKQECIFERFRQGNESLCRKYEGVGLGLAISKAYIEMLGGIIGVESEERKGSVFYFSLPFGKT